MIGRLHIIKNNSEKVKAMRTNLSVKNELLELLSAFVTQTKGLTAKDQKELAATIALANERIPDKMEELPNICGLIVTTLNYFDALSAKQNAARTNISLAQFCEKTGLKQENVELISKKTRRPRSR
jgi:hypothetical protein